MQLNPLGRAVFGLNAATVVAGLAVQLPASYDSKEGFFTGWSAAFNTFSYFTTQSNIVLAVTCALLAVGVVSEAQWFAALRMIGVVGIALTFVVYHVALSDLRELTSGAKFADVMLHTVSPILGVGGWLLFGPRGLTSRAAVGWTTAYVAAWGLFSMVRGAVVERADGRRFYPYPFMDAQDKGYAPVLVNLVVVGLVFLVIAVGVHLLDQWLTRRRPAPAHQ